MLVLRVSDAYPITPGPGQVRNGTIGLWFSTAGDATVETKLGEIITVGGQVGSFFECPIARVTASNATLLGVMGR